MYKVACSAAGPVWCEASEDPGGCLQQADGPVQFGDIGSVLEDARHQAEQCTLLPAELQGLSGVKPAEMQEAVCGKAMALCSVVTRYGATPLPDGKAATVDAFLARLIRQALLPSQLL